MRNPKPPPIQALCDQVATWFDTPLGQAVLADERELLTPVLESIFGVYLIQFGFDARQVLHDLSPVTHHFILSPRLEEGLKPNTVVASNHAAPIASESVDAVVLHHSLDFSYTPHSVLREASRILRPGGHLISVSFNSGSVWRVMRHFSGNKKEAPWCSHFLTRQRLQDWFELMELTVLQCKIGSRHLPCKYFWREENSMLPAWLARYYGSILILHARKDIVGITPKINLAKRPRLMSLPVSRPS